MVCILILTVYNTADFTLKQYGEIQLEKPGGFSYITLFRNVNYQYDRFDELLLSNLKSS